MFEIAENDRAIKLLSELNIPPDVLNSQSQQRQTAILACASGAAAHHDSNLTIIYEAASHAALIVPAKCCNHIASAIQLVKTGITLDTVLSVETNARAHVLKYAYHVTLLLKAGASLAELLRLKPAVQAEFIEYFLYVLTLVEVGITLDALSCLAPALRAEVFFYSLSIAKSVKAGISLEALLEIPHRAVRAELLEHRWAFVPVAELFEAGISLEALLKLEPTVRTKIIQHFLRVVDLAKKGATTDALTRLKPSLLDQILNAHSYDEAIRLSTEAGIITPNNGLKPKPTVQKTAEAQSSCPVQLFWPKGMSVAAAGKLCRLFAAAPQLKLEEKAERDRHNNSDLFYL